MTDAFHSPSRSMLTLLLLVCSATFCSVAQATAEASPKETVNSVLATANGVSWGPGIVAVVAIAVGAVICGAGYRLFRAAIFVCGFIVGGLCVAGAVEYVFANESWIATGSWIGFLVGGLIVGSIAMALYTTSIFIAGAAAGVLLAFTLHTTVTYKISASHPNTVLIISAILLGLVGGWLAVKLEKPVLVIATSFVGATMVTWGVGYFGGDFPNGADLTRYQSQTFNGDLLIEIPTAWWGYLAGLLALFVFGMVIQFRKTGRHGDYHSVGRKTTVKQHQYNDVQTPANQHAIV